jgi:FtsP/CotA-like multicopper oxidase with cupredoxin domain
VPRSTPAPLLFACLAAAACAATPEEVSPAPGRLPELAHLTDLNPDPDVVEVRLIASLGEVEYLPGKPTSVWAYRDGAAPGSLPTVPGPLLDAKRGDRIVVHFENELPEASTIHFHGVRLPAAMDGAHGEILRGEAFDYDFIARDAGTFWYHPHFHADRQIERGLYGPMVVREGDGGTGGDRLLVLDDVKLGPDGAVDEVWSDEDIAHGRRGDTLLVNGVPSPTLRAAAGSRERWRLVNASNGRAFDLALPGRAFEVIGWDGGLLEAPYTAETLLIAPGERYDVLVELGGSSGGALELVTRAHDHGDGAVDPEAPVLRVELEEGPRSDAAPAERGAISPLPVPEGAAPRSFVLTEDLDGKYGPQFFINGEFWPFNEPIGGTLGDVEVWEIDNQADGDHPFHLHGMFFQVLDRAGAPEPRLGWKDTVLVRAGEALRFAVRYEEPGAWMYHCQIPEHAERGMMGELIVSPP